MRRRLKRHLNRRNRRKDQQRLGYFGRFVQSENLWHVNRHSVAKAAAVGLFSAYMPMPMEMVVAALLAVIVRANVPISVLLIWISNPFTWVLLYGPPYLLGAWLLGYENVHFNNLSLAVLQEGYSALWLGCLIVGSAIAAGAYFTVHILWRMDVVSDWETRRERKRAYRELIEARQDEALKSRITPDDEMSNK